MRKPTRPRSALAVLAFAPLLLPMCVTRPTAVVLVEPPDLAMAPDCFWAEHHEMTMGRPGPFPCIEVFIADALQKDCETDDMFERKTSQVLSCANYHGDD